MHKSVFPGAKQVVANRASETLFVKGTVQYKERERSHNKPHGSGLSVQGGKEKDQTGPVDKNQDHGERCGVRERGEEETDVIDLSSSRMPGVGQSTSHWPLSEWLPFLFTACYLPSVLSSVASPFHSSRCST